MATSRDRIYKSIARMSLADKQTLQIWLNEQIAAEQLPPQVDPKRNREVVETKTEGRTTYQSELIRCGKPNCRCASKGQLHGPYWYGYRKESKRLKSWYIGKNLPANLAKDEGLDNINVSLD